MGFSVAAESPAESGGTVNSKLMFWFECLLQAGLMFACGERLNV
jgi:hypothetical protein